MTATGAAWSAPSPPTDAPVSPSVVGQVAEQPGPGMGHHALAAGGHRRHWVDARYASLRKCPPGSGFCGLATNSFHRHEGFSASFALLQW